MIAVEKRITSPLMDPSSIEKIVEIDTHIACAMSGLTADARTMIDRARVEAQNYWFTYNEPMPVKSVTQAVCNLAMQFGEGGEAEAGTMSRPFGVALLLAGVDKEGGVATPVLYSADPSGTYIAYDAKAIGSGSEGAQTALQESYDKSMSLEQAETLALETLKQVMEEKISAGNVEVAAVTTERNYHQYPKDKVEAILGRLSA